MKSQIKNYYNNLSNAINKISVDEIENCAKVLIKAHKNNNNIFICGNGGSASTASHFACDINKGVSYGLEKRFKIIPLTDNFATITAYSNDLNYEMIFVEQIKNFFQEKDVLIAISGSGNSKNVIKAVEFVNQNNGISIGWTGYDGGKLKEITNFSINANYNDMQICEDMHMSLVHVLMKVIRKYLTGSESYL